MRRWLQLNEALSPMRVRVEENRHMRRYPKIEEANNYVRKRLEEECSRSYKHIHTRNGTLEIIPIKILDLKCEMVSQLHIKVEYGEKVLRSTSVRPTGNLTWYYEEGEAEEGGQQQTKQSSNHSSVMKFDVNASLVESAIRVRVLEEFYTHNKEMARVELPVLNLLDCICNLEKDAYYDQWFPLTLSVDSIQAEGERQKYAQTVLSEQVPDSSFPDKKPCIRLKIRWIDDKDDPGGEQKSHNYDYFRLQLPSLSISIVDSGSLTKMARDVLHISCTGSDIRHYKSNESTSWIVNINWFQIDNQLADCTAPVLLAPIVVQKSKPVFMMQSLKNNLLSTDKLNSYDFIALQIQELDVKLEQQTVATLWDIWQSWLRDHRLALSEYMEKNIGNEMIGSELLGFASCRTDSYGMGGGMGSVAMFNQADGGGSADRDDDHQRKLYIRTCVLKELKINISFIIGSTPLSSSNTKALSTERFAIGKSVGLAYTLFAFLRQLGEVVIDLSSSISDAPIRINQYSEHHIFLTEQEFSKRLQNHYFQFLMQGVYKIVGSLDMLGNPVGLFSALGTGVVDFFYEPALAMFDSPSEINKLNKLGKGFLKGAISLVSNTGTGVIGAGTTVTRTVGRNFAKLSMDSAFIRNREELQRAPKTIKEALVRPFRDVGNGIYCGVVGLVKGPYNAFRANKPSTIMYGIMIGVAGLATKPSVGVLDAVTHTGEAFQLIMKELRHDYAEPITRGRLSYVFGVDGRIFEYDYATALGHKILDVLSIVKEDQGLGHSIKDGSRLFMKFGKLFICKKGDGAVDGTAIAMLSKNQAKSSKGLSRADSFRLASRGRGPVIEVGSPHLDARGYINETGAEFVIHVTIIPKGTPGLDQVVILTTSRVIVVDYQRKKGGSMIKLQYEISLKNLMVIKEVGALVSNCTLNLLNKDDMRQSNGQFKETVVLGPGDFRVEANKAYEDALETLRKNINIVANSYFDDTDADEEHGHIYKIGAWEFTTKKDRSLDENSSGFDNRYIRSTLENSKWHFFDCNNGVQPMGGINRGDDEMMRLPSWLQGDVEETIRAHSDISEISNLLDVQYFVNEDHKALNDMLRNQEITFKEYKKLLDVMNAMGEQLEEISKYQSVAAAEGEEALEKGGDDSSPSSTIGKIMNYTAKGFDRVVTSTRNVGAVAASAIGKKSPMQLSSKHGKKEPVPAKEREFSVIENREDAGGMDSDSPIQTNTPMSFKYISSPPMPLSESRHDRDTSFQDCNVSLSQLSNAESVSLLLSRLERLENLILQVAESNLKNNNSSDNNNDGEK